MVKQKIQKLRSISRSVKKSESKTKEKWPWVKDSQDQWYLVGQHNDVIGSSRFSPLKNL